jgi:hypothetical protein
MGLGLWQMEYIRVHLLQIMYSLLLMARVMVFYATFKNISVTVNQFIFAAIMFHVFLLQDSFAEI